MHIRNNAFSALVSHSLTMIACGLEKQQTKNMIAKVSKSFGLLENQINDLLKFIEAGHDSLCKIKKT